MKPLDTNCLCQTCRKECLMITLDNIKAFVEHVVVVYRSLTSLMNESLAQTDLESDTPVPSVHLAAEGCAGLNLSSMVIVCDRILALISPPLISDAATVNETPKLRGKPVAIAGTLTFSASQLFIQMSLQECHPMHWRVCRHHTLCPLLRGGYSAFTCRHMQVINSSISQARYCFRFGNHGACITWSGFSFRYSR